MSMSFPNRNTSPSLQNTPRISVRIDSSADVVSATSASKGSGDGKGFGPADSFSCRLTLKTELAVPRSRSDRLRYRCCRHTLRPGMRVVCFALGFPDFQHGCRTDKALGVAAIWSMPTILPEIRNPVLTPKPKSTGHNQGEITQTVFCRCNGSRPEENSPATTVKRGASNGLAYSINQFCVDKWFCKVVSNPSVKGTRMIVFAREGSYENGGNRVSEL
jgi:hypothetical protein